MSRRMTAEAKVNRVRWMRAQFPGSIRQIGKQLQRASFTADTDQGFVVDRVRDEFLEARYFERIAFQESVTDPFGNTFVVERLDFREVDFTLTKTFPELELRMPPRALRGFTSGLLKASGFSMELSSHKVVLSEWIRALERDLRTKISVRSLVASGVELTGGAAARVAITGPSDVRTALAELIPANRYDLDTIQIDFPYERNSQRIILASDSSVRYGERTPPEILESLRKAFEATGRTAR